MQNVLRVEDGRYLGGNVGDVEERLEAVESDVEQISLDLSELKNNALGTVVSLTQNNIYTCPSDGYVVAACSYGNANYATITVYGSNDSSPTFNVTAVGNGAAAGVASLLVRKGMKVRYNGGTNAQYGQFIPLQ